MPLTPVQMSLPDSEGFLVGIEEGDGFPPLSEHKMLRLAGAGDAVVTAWGIEDTPVALSVAAFHEGDEPHWALEVAVAADHRTADAEQAAITAAESTLPAGATFSLWSARPEQVTAATTLGYHEIRRVLRMEGVLPAAPERPDVELATIDDVDDDALIAVHNRAFAGHREASGMTAERVDDLRALPWYDPKGVLVALMDGAVAGFCWTKLHPNGDGEVYLLAVDPGTRGAGLGRLLAAAGYDYLRRSGAEHAMLWVDGDNAAAIDLYRALGLEVTRANVELTR